MNLAKWIWPLLFLLPASELPAQTLRVMTFNVRYAAANDGEDRWELRRDLLVSAIREKDPDLIGTQELFYEQGQYIVEKAPDYVWFGISRRGNREDEHMGIFYKKDKFRLIDSGNFWLSETPEIPGSMSWEVSLPRMVTWGLFEMKAGGRRFTLYNTHFPHRREDDEARARCASVILGRIEKLPAQTPFILTGDFNADPASAPYAAFSRQLKDARIAALRRTGPDGTSSGFRGNTEGRRIDWILYRGGLKPLESETVVYTRNGRYPSDHFPVFTLFELQN